MMCVCVCVARRPDRFTDLWSCWVILVLLSLYESVLNNGEDIRPHDTDISDKSRPSQSHTFVFLNCVYTHLKESCDAGESFHHERKLKHLSRQQCVKCQVKGKIERSQSAKTIRDQIENNEMFVFFILYFSILIHETKAKWNLCFIDSERATCSWTEEQPGTLNTLHHCQVLLLLEDEQRETEEELLSIDHSGFGPGEHPAWIFLDLSQNNHYLNQTLFTNSNSLFPSFILLIMYSLYFVYLFFHVQKIPLYSISFYFTFNSILTIFYFDSICMTVESYKTFHCV